MKQLKLDGHKDLSLKKSSLSKAFKILKNSKGVSLVELMMTVTIGVIVSLGIASVFVFAMQQFVMLVEKNAAEESALQSAFYLRQYLSQAVELNAVNAINASNWTCPGSAGCGVIDVNFRLLDENASGPVQANPDQGNFTRFAVFNREVAFFRTGIDGIPDGVGNLQPTAIFVKDTRSASIGFPDASSGGLVFSYNREYAGGSFNIVPQASDLFLSRLHDFRVQRVDCNGAADGLAVEVVNAETGELRKCLPRNWAQPAGQAMRIKTITLEVVTRYFKTATKSDWNYRFPEGGGSAGPYRDIVQTVKINFKNNVLTEVSRVGQSGGPERVHGSLYFFDYLVPIKR